MPRPRIDLTEHDIEQIELLAGYGLSIQQIGSVIGISKSTLDSRRATEKRVAEAVERGRAMAEAKIGKSLFERAIDGDIAAIRWWEMTRAKRSAEAKIEHTGTQTVTVAPAPDWRALIGPQLSPQPPDHAA
jgi:predicted DNA-binding protein (UPF0251 family)